jgi:hypothetical protein
VSTKRKSNKYKLTLTGHDLGRVAAVRDSWVATGLSTDAVSEERVWPLVRALYAAHGVPAPKLRVRMSSPVGAVCAAAICRGLQGQQWESLRQQFCEVPYRDLDRQINHELSGPPDNPADVWAPDRFMRPILRRLLDPVASPPGALVLGGLGSQLRDMLLGYGLTGRLDRRLRARIAGELGWKLRRRLTDQIWGRLGAAVTRWDDLKLGPWENGISLAVYDLALPLAGLPRSRTRDALAAVLRETGWFIPMRGAAVISDRPGRLELDAQPRLHSADGMAVAWRDGCGFYYWHGRLVPEWVVRRPTVAAISAERNVEIRRCAIESLGWESFVAETAAALIGTAADPGNPGQDLSLYEIPERLWGSPANLLVAVNGTTERDGTRRRYGLTTPAEIRDPVAAAAWTYQLTKDEYAACQRRT